MKSLTFLFFSLIIYLGTSGQSADTLKPQKINEKTIVGKYIYKGNEGKSQIKLEIKKNYKAIYTLISDTSQNVNTGEWIIVNDTLIIKFKSGKSDCSECFRSNNNDIRFIVNNEYLIMLYMQNKKLYFVRQNKKD